MPVCVDYGPTRRCQCRHRFQTRSIRIWVEGKCLVSDQLLPSVTKALACLPVHINNRPLLEVLDEEGIPRVIHKCAKARLALAQRLLGALALRDIDVCTDYEDRPAALRGNMMTNCLDIFNGSVG